MRLTHPLIQIGLGRSEAIDLPAFAETEIWEFRPHRGPAIVDVRKAVTECVESPCDFPAISQAVVEGDRVVLAVDGNIPSVAEVVAGVVDALPLQTLAHLSVLLSQETSPQTLVEVVDAVADRGDVLVHDPQNREQHGYLAANAAAEPIYLNRQLIEADLAIPIITARPAGSLDPNVMDGGVMPAFADADTQNRLRQETIAAGGADDREAAEAAWLLGVQMLVAVMPTARAEVAQVFAGTPAGVRRQTDLANAANHRADVAHRADISEQGREDTAEQEPAAVALAHDAPACSRKAELVFACLDGDRQQQSWQNVARALHVARHLINPGGTIVVTSHLAAPIGRSLRRLASTEDWEKTQKRLARDAGPDTLAATLISQLRQEGRVLLMSDLAAEQIESLGIGAIETPEQINRLIRGHATCAVIRSAQFCGTTQFCQPATAE